MRLINIFNHLYILGNPEPSHKVVEKLLQVHYHPSRFAQIALSIETMLDISTLSIEEVITRLSVVDDLFPYATTVDVNGKLLHTKGGGEHSDEGTTK